jgi:hypothetical protein
LNPDWSGRLPSTGADKPRLKGEKRDAFIPAHPGIPEDALMRIQVGLGHGGHVVVGDVVHRVASNEIRYRGI